MDSGFPTPRPANAQYMGNYAAPALARPRVAFIGAGRRAHYLARVLAQIEGVDIVAICDVDSASAAQLSQKLESLACPAPVLYTQGAMDYQRMLVEQSPDAVFVTVGWGLHAEMCCEIMRHGAHAFTEVPLAMSLEQIWQVIDATELYQRHCMMLENACYDREELLFLNLVQQGVIGDVVHGEGAYIHDLRFVFSDDSRTESQWRAHYYMNRNGNLYPTHGIGAISQYMGLGRGQDQFGYLVSLSSRAMGFSNYMQEYFEADHPYNAKAFACGDVNTSLIKTYLGNTIMLQWNECSTRPYSRRNLIQGTLGTLLADPTRIIAKEFIKGDAHDWLEGEALQAVYEKYEHPLWARLGAKAQQIAGPRARDYLMLSRLVECLQQGLPLDQNVYEGAYWSSITDLSESSVQSDGAPVAFPDFTRGDWVNTLPVSSFRKNTP